MPERHRSSKVECMLYKEVILILPEEATSAVELSFPRTVEPYSSLLHNALTNLVYDADIGTPTRNLYPLSKAEIIIEKEILEWNTQGSRRTRRQTKTWKGQEVMTLGKI